VTGRVEGKVAFITGAARGQGRAHALALAAEGADIIAVDLCAAVGWTTYPGATPADLEETVRLVEGQGRRIVARQGDVRDRAALQDALGAGLAEFGRLDIVVANAGVGRINAWDDTSPEVWQDTIDINLTGSWNTVMAAAPLVASSGGGSIILISSSGGLKSHPFMVPYTASKFGITGMAKAFAQELAPLQIRVNSIHPGGVDTPMARGADDIASLMAGNPQLAGTFANLQQVDLLPPEDVSTIVLFLASEDSRHVTGSAVVVDAGATAL
jgi:SDR family mycofactocin-dependent oxidoreductase